MYVNAKFNKKKPINCLTKSEIDAYLESRTYEKDANKKFLSKELIYKNIESEKIMEKLDKHNKMLEKYMKKDNFSFGEYNTLEVINSEGRDSSSIYSETNNYEKYSPKSTCQKNSPGKKALDNITLNQAIEKEYERFKKNKLQGKSNQRSNQKNNQKIEVNNNSNNDNIPKGKSLWKKMQNMMSCGMCRERKTDFEVNLKENPRNNRKVLRTPNATMVIKD